MNQNPDQTPAQGDSQAAEFSLESDTPLERPEEGKACSLEPGCESCQ